MHTATMRNSNCKYNLWHYKKMLTNLMICFLVAGFMGYGGTAQAEAPKKRVEELNGYFVKNTVKFNENYDFKHLVVTNQEDFDRYFGIARTMQNQVDEVNFVENSVIAIMTKPSNIAKKTGLVYHEFDGDNLFILYKIIEGDKNPYQSTSLYLATIPKNITQVKFKSRYNVGIVNVK